MRKIYKYQIIRYYPYSLSEEFINIGILLEGKCMHKVISEDEANMIHCSALIGDKKKFLGVVRHLNELSKKECLQDDYHYFNNFKYTEIKQIATDKEPKEVLSGLFYEYISHKFPTKETLDAKQLIIENSYKLIHKEFKKHLRIYRTSNLYDLEIESIKSQEKHHSIIGSVSNKQDVSKAIMAVPAHVKQLNKYDFLDISIKHLNQSVELKEKLKVNHVDCYDYAKQDDIVEYLEAIA